MQRVLHWLFQRLPRRGQPQPRDDDGGGQERLVDGNGPAGRPPVAGFRGGVKPAGNYLPRLIVEMADFDTLSAAQVRLLMRAFELKDITLAELEPLSGPGGELAGLLPWDQLRSDLGGGCRFGRLRNGLNLAVLRELEERAQDMAQLYAPLRYFSLEPPAIVDSIARSNALATLNEPTNQAAFGIKRAYEVVNPTYLPAPPKPPADTHQTFLNAAIDGINAEAAWREPGGYGHDVRFVDIEYSWYLQHPDLPAVETIYEDDFTYTYTDPANPENAVQDHGTAMLGIVVAQHNDPRNAFGIAPSAEAYVLSSLLSDASHDLPGTILQACISILRPGDVLLIEGQIEQLVNGAYTFLPVEVDPAVFDAIRFAVNLGVVVIEPAGNGNQDLDLLNGPALGFPTWSPLTDNALNSGAIMVAAGQLGVVGGVRTYARWTNSNYGARIDCFAHGDYLWSLSNRSGSPYRSEEGGTSAAAAIVAGAAVLVQSIFKQKDGGENVLSPERVRELLRDNGTPGSGTLTSSLPDLARIVPLVKNEPVKGLPSKPITPPSLAAALEGPAVARDIPRISTPV